MTPSPSANVAGSARGDQARMTNVENLNLAESDDLRTSLKKQLGIDEKSVDDGSPHRFFDWQSDSKGGGAADPSNFLPIQEQIRLRQ